MLKQDIIKARKELAVKEALDKGHIFERTYKTIREALYLMVDRRQAEVRENSVSIAISKYTVRRLESLGIIVREYSFSVFFRLERL